MSDDCSEDTGGYGIIHKHLRGRLDAYEIAAYVALTWRTNANGTCWIRHGRLAEEAGMSVSKLKMVLNTLRDKGEITWEPKYGDDGQVVCNVYTVVRLSGQPQVTPPPVVWPPDGEGVATPWRPGGHGVATERTTKKELPRSSSSSDTEPAADADALFSVEEPPKKRRRQTQVPPDFQPTDANRTKAASFGLNIDFELEQFIAHHEAKGTLGSNWASAFSYWLGNAAKYARQRGVVTPIRPEQSARELTPEEIANNLPPVKKANWYR